MAITFYLLNGPPCTDQREESLSSNSLVCNKTAVLRLVWIGGRRKSQRKIDGNKAVTAMPNAKMAQEMS